MPRFPARSFIRFFRNHGLLGLSGRLHWRTVEGGARAYVERLSAPFAARIRRNARVVRVARDGAGVTVADASGGQERFDQVVIAAHAPQALAMLADPSPEEARVLGAMRTQSNRAVLHGDARLMPRRRRAWASWNYLGRTTRPAEAAVSVTYWMNLLQSLDRAPPLFVSLNPLVEPGEGTAIADFAYEHPLLDGAALAAQGSIGALQGVRRTWFCGAWCGWGFHEDGLAAGLAVAECLGARRPWTTAEASPAGANVRPHRPAAEAQAA
jgi:predicted NAD/FAD-binding protein